MSIPYKVVTKSQPGVVGGGTKQYYPVAVSSGEMDLKDLTTAIEKISTVNGADIRGALYAIAQVSAGALAEGKIVRLGELGHLRISLQGKGQPTSDAVTAAAITGSKIVFTPGPIFKQMQQLLTYKKV